MKVSRNLLSILLTKTFHGKNDDYNLERQCLQWHHLVDCLDKNKDNAILGAKLLQSLGVDQEHSFCYNNCKSFCFTCQITFLELLLYHSTMIRVTFRWCWDFFLLVMRSSVYICRFLKSFLIQLSVLYKLCTDSN